MQSAVGIDIGGTKIAAGLVNVQGELVWADREPTPATQGPAAIGEAVVRVARRVVGEARARGMEPRGVGIGTGGQVDVVRQRVVGATRVLDHWAEFPLRDQVQGALGLPVWLDNDAKAAARAELRWGSGRGLHCVVFVTLGTGVGGAIAIDGRVVDGARGFAGHIGHITVRPGGAVCSCGRRGCLEAYASARGILRRARELGGRDATVDDATEVFRLATEGVSWAQLAIQEAADVLGQGLADLVHVLNPDRVVVGGGLSAWGEGWLHWIERSLRAQLMDAFQETVTVALASFGPWAGVMGAAALALEQLAHCSQ